MELLSKIKFVNDDLKEDFYKLEKGDSAEKELFKAINHALDELEKNAFSGIQIPKRLIPKEYKQKYNVKNLWKYNLSKGWRVLYSIFAEEVLVISLILEWCNHKEYEKKFNY